MKKKSITIKAAVFILIIGIGIISTLCIIEMHRTETLKSQQNYMASRLIEMGAYEQGRILAIQNNQMKENDIAQELIVLAAGFQSDYMSGIRNAEEYLKAGADEIMQEAVLLYQDCLAELEKLPDAGETAYQEEKQKLDDRIFEELMALLFRTEEKIKAKVDNETLQVMLDIMSSQDMIDYGNLELLQKDNSALSTKVQASYNLRHGDYDSAFENAKSMYQKNKSFENETLVANITVMGGENLGSEGADSKVVKESIYAERAINFIETVTPITERKTAAYNLERAYLYFYAGREKKSREILNNVLAESADHDETVAVLLRDFIYVYKVMNGSVEDRRYQAYKQQDLDTSWARIQNALYLIEKDNSFYEFVLGIIDDVYNGLIIRNIDTSAYPQVQVTVNVAFDAEERLKKENFVVKDMDAVLGNYSVTSTEELENMDAVSVVLVVDRSSSMEGEPLEDTKKAVVSFVKNINSDIRTGLISFDDTAQIVAPLTDSNNAVLQGVRAIESGGGTSIWAGLRAAGDELMYGTGRKIIILLSDGEDGDTSKIDEVLGQLNQRNIYVYTIGFGGADTEYLSYIANSCKGKFIQAQSSDMLGAVYAEIGSYMANEYLITFEAVTETDNFSRLCSVSVDINNAVAEKKYHVGVSYDEIKAEENKKPSADYFREVGGSRIDAE